MSSTRSRVARRTLLVGLALVAASAGTASGAPAVPTSPADGARTDTRRPTFSWTAATPRLFSEAPIDRYEVRLEPDGTVVANVPAGTLSAVAAAALPDDADLRWYVVAIDGGGAQESARNDLAVVTRPVPPAFVSGPAGPTRGAAPTFAWSGDRPSSAWALIGAGGATLREDVVPAGGGEVSLPALADGDYIFRVAQRDREGAAGDPAARGFRVDTVAPGALAVTPAQQATSTAPVRSFSWTGTEPGSGVEWRVIGVGGGLVQGPAAATGNNATLAPVPAGSYVFEARQTDPAGNAGAWSASPFAVLPSPAAAPAASGGGAVLQSRNWKRLTPRRGARVTSRRPVLRWTKGPKRTTTYNVQVFRVRPGGRPLLKVYSAFPRGNRVTIPPRARLARGACYVWRVWPFIGRRQISAPLGISNFCVR